MAYAVKGTLEESCNTRKKNKEPPSKEGGSCSLVVQHGLNGGLGDFLIPVVQRAAHVEHLVVTPFPMYFLDRKGHRLKFSMSMR